MFAALVVHMRFIEFLVLLLSYGAMNAVFAKELDVNERRQALIQKIETANIEDQIEKYGEVRRIYLRKNNMSPDHQIYYDLIIKKINSMAKTNFPESILRDGRAVSVIFTIELDRSGKLIKASLNKKSGFKMIDEFAASILRRSQPYPKFGTQFADSIQTVVIFDSMHFNFRNEKTKDN